MPNKERNEKKMTNNKTTHKICAEFQMSPVLITCALPLHIGSYHCCRMEETIAKYFPSGSSPENKQQKKEISFT